MNITVQVFARAKELVGESQVEVALPESACVRDLREALGEQYPALRPLVGSLLVAIGNEYAADTTMIEPTSKIACFPPVSGG